MKQEKENEFSQLLGMEKVHVILLVDYANSTHQNTIVRKSQRKLLKILCHLLLHFLVKVLFSSTPSKRHFRLKNQFFNFD